MSAQMKGLRVLPLACPGSPGHLVSASQVAGSLSNTFGQIPTPGERL